MEFEKTFGRRRNGTAITLFHRDGDSSCLKDAHLLHMHPDYELYFCLCGICDFILEGGRYRLQPGQMILTRPGSLHSIDITKDCRYNRCYIHIPGAYFDDLVDANASPLRLFSSGISSAVLQGEDFTRVVRLLEDMEQKLSLPDERGEVHAMADFWQLCAIATDVLFQGIGEEVNLLHPTVRRTVEYINANYARILSVSDVAEEMGVSPAYLSRLFRAGMKTTVSAYLRFKRMEQARELLRQGKELLEVCDLCGYSDYSYFIAEFRRQHGITPMRYRKESAKIEGEQI